MIERQLIEGSSNVKSIGFDGRIAEVEFKDGKVYEVEGLTQQQFQEFMDSKSKGTWYHKNVRLAGLPTKRKVEEKPN